MVHGLIPIILFRLNVHIKMTILILEPFYGGSHKQLVDIFLQNLTDSQVHVISTPAKKWHWRARTSALWFSQNTPENAKITHLFASSVLNLCELLGLRPDLNRVRKGLFLFQVATVYVSFFFISQSHCSNGCI